MQRHLPKADKGFHLRGLVHLAQPSRYLLKHCPPPMPGNRQRRRTDYQIPPDPPQSSGVLIPQPAPLYPPFHGAGCFCFVCLQENDLESPPCALWRYSVEFYYDDLSLRKTCGFFGGSFSQMGVRRYTSSERKKLPLSGSTSPGRGKMAKPKRGAPVERMRD